MRAIDKMLHFHLLCKLFLGHIKQKHLKTLVKKLFFFIVLDFCLMVVFLKKCKFICITVLFFNFNFILKRYEIELFSLTRQISCSKDLIKLQEKASGRL